MCSTFHITKVYVVLKVIKTVAGVGGYKTCGSTCLTALTTSTALVLLYNTVVDHGHWQSINAPDARYSAPATSFLIPKCWLRLVTKIYLSMQHRLHHQTLNYDCFIKLAKLSIQNMTFSVVLLVL